MSELAARIAALSPAQRQLLERRLAREGLAAERREDGIPRLPEAERYDLSWGQLGLWFVEQLAPGTPAYNIPFAGRLEGPLDLEVLERSVGEIVRRHEILRTTFTMVDGRAVQAVAPELALSLRRDDLSGLPDEERAAAAERRVDQEARVPFDLTRPPLLRVRVLRLAPEDHYLLVTMPHIVTDAWSMAVFFRELPAIYEAFADGRPSPLPELPIQFRDYAAWQRGSLQGERLDRLVAFWREELSGAPTVLELPADRPRPPAHRFRGRRLALDIPSEVARGLRELGRREGTTPFMTLLAAFGVLLHRYTGEEEVLINTPVATRERPETGGLIGYFINTLVLRTELGGDPTFRELLERVRRRCLAAFAHQDLPFEKLVEAMGVERTLRHAPLSQVTLVLQNVHIPPPAFRDLRLASFQQTDSRTSKLDLMLGLWESGEELAGWFEYDTDLFDETTVARMAANLGTLFRSILDDPGRRLSELALLSPEERRRIEGWSAGGPAPAAGRCVHDLVAEQAARTPAAEAVRCGGEALSYAELVRRAGRLAARLTGLGVGPERRVGVCAERSVDLVAAVLGALEAGGAYVPLDPVSPPARLRRLAADAGLVAVVASRRLEGLAAGLGVEELVWLEDALAGEEPPPAARPAGGAGPDRLAYVLYTSGSTGEPKGVMVSHRNLAASTLARDAVYPEPPVAYLVSSPLGFDASVAGLFWTLVRGGTVVLPEEAEARDPAALGALVVGRRVSYWDSVPSLYQALLEQVEPEALGSLSAVVVGAEACPPALVAAHRRRLPRARLYNEYGPTETTVWATAAECSGAEAATVPIGRPIPGARVHVLDARMAPVPVGVAGELYVGGAGVSRGYLGRPGPTAERFVPDPFGAPPEGEPGARLYRTGDRARWRADGRLELLGRLDDQVKVRGHRVEPGEVEAALAAHPGVAGAAVAARSDGAGGFRLVGYVVGRGGKEAPGAEELRAWLAERLPEPMVPAAFVELPELPRTASGKLDRRALPEPGGGRPELETAYRAPRDEVEAALAAICAEVLGVERVGVDDGFFALGGDSIASLRVVSRARQAGLDLAPAAFFEEPTVAGLARRAREASGLPEGREGAIEAAPEIDPEVLARLGWAPEEVADAYELSPLQEGILFHEVATPGRGFYVQQATCTIEGTVDGARLRESWRRAVARHEALRASFHWQETERPLQVVHRRAEPGWTEEDWRGLASAEREERLAAFLAADRERGFDPARPPLVRLALFRTGEERWRFVWTHHHLILDGWSSARVLAEVFRRYEEPEAALPPARRFGEHVRWLRGRDLGAAREAWRRRLAGFTAPTPLPLARERPAGEEGWFRTERALPAEETAALAGLARRAGCTLSTVVHAAWAVALARLTREREVVFGTVVAGRPAELAGTEEMVGMFINTVPVRVAVARDEPALALLERLHGELGALREHDLVPLVDVQAASDLPPGTPLFQSLLAFESFPAEALSRVSTRGATLRDHRSLERTHYPLTLTAVPGERLTLRLAGDRARYSEEAAARVLSTVAGLLAAMAEAPARRVGELPLQSEAERRRVEGWTAMAPAPAAGRCLHELVAEQAARTPGAEAVRCGEEALSYAELERRADAVAARLAGLGVRPESRVGVCVERSVELVVAVLGVLRAGGAYVPLDPSYPAERLRYLARDAGVAAVVARRRLAGLLAGLGVGEAVWVEEAAAGDGEPAPPPASGVGPDHLAYVLYTSGSTGEPKGVMVSHRNAVASTLARDAVNSEPPSRFLLLASIAFDASVAGLFWTLARGGTVVVPDDETRRDPARLAELVALRGVTYWHSIPALYSRLLEQAGGGEALASLAAVIVGAEPCPPALVRTHRERLPGARLYNQYGPTEATVWATAAECSGAEEPTVPIGRPIPGARVRVLDEGMAPAPVGVAGELYVGGAGVARGYLGRPGLTAERFVPDPFEPTADGAPGARLYRTGDRARWREDGQLELLGRLDDQVKVRGYRVEPGEVEAALIEHPGVGRAAVAARSDGAGGLRLVGYVVARDGREAPGAEALRGWLAGRLPAYMVPAAFVELPELPVTPSGKLDRRALPAPGGERPALETAYRAPRDTVEAELAAIWADVLGLERVGVDDGFFALGGDSIATLRVVSRARRAGLDLSPAELFEEPTVAGLARRARGRAAADADAGAAAPGGEVGLPPEALAPLGWGPEEVADAYELTPLQEGILFHEVATPGRGFYVQQATCAIEGPVDEARLRESWRRVVARHDALRTSFHWQATERPLQVVHRRAEPRWNEEDWRGLPEPEQEERLAAYLAADRERGFEVERPPLVRLALFRTGEERRRFVWTHHHLILDGWSSARVLAEVFRLYREPEAELPPARRFRDHVAWLRSREPGAAREAWRERLAGFTAPTPLPLAREEAAGDGGEGFFERERTLAADETAALAALARRAGCTPSTVLHAAWAVALARLSGEREAVFGTVTAGRPAELAGVEEMVGMFINTVPARVAVRPGEPVAALLARLQGELGALRELELVPLVDVQAASELPRGTPLFESVLAFDSYPAADLGGAGDGGPALRDHRSLERAHYPLSLIAVPGPSLRLTLACSAARYDEATADRLLDLVRRLLREMAARPEAVAGALPLVSEEERTRLVEAWNASPFPSGRLVHELVTEQAAATPDAVAVRCGEEALTYAGLERRAGAVAARLAAAGVGPEVRVGICLDPGPAFMAAVLGVLRSGGAFLPLDPSHPRERLRWLVEDAGAGVVVAGRRLAGVAAALGAREVVWVEEAGAGEAGLAAPAHPQALAYVIYTSGSTGRPKGVMVPHRGAVNLAREFARRMAVGPGDRVLQFASPSFDASVVEWLMTLTAGATLVTAPRELRLPGEPLLELLEREGVTHWIAPPSALRALPAAGLPRLTCLMAAGEASSEELVARWARPGRRFLNGYGPTEATVCATIGECSPGSGRPPIGRPIANVRAYVLDEGLSPLPVGAAGELCVGGVGVARGYLGRPGLTAERFVPDPFGPLSDGLPGGRLYRTGDRARWREDGELEFLGRLDAQVKVRGHRVEPGEVEAALAAHPALGGAAVVARDDGAGALRLVGYVVGRGGQAAPGPEKLRAWLAERLPEPMVPAAFVELAELPVTASGKVDRRALPAPDGGRPELEAPYVAPHDEVEAALAAIWAEVLGVERVGVLDGFFALGGDSIASLRVASRARQAGLELSPAAVLEEKTVAALARRAVRAAPAVAPAAESAVEVPLTPVQRWFFDTVEEDLHHWNLSLPLEVPLEGPGEVPGEARTGLSPDLLEEALAAVVAHHDALRLRFARGPDGAWRQRRVPPAEAGPVEVRRVDLSGLDGEQELAAAEAACGALQAGLDLGAGPLLGAAWLDRGAGRPAWLLLAAHHLAVDVVSWGVLLEDLRAAAAAVAAGEPVRLPPATTGFGEWAERLARAARTPAFAGELDRWLERAAIEVPPLPRDLPGDDNREGTVRLATAVLEAETTAALLRQAPAAYRATAEDLVLAAFAAALARWSGCWRLRIDVEGHGRETARFPGADLARSVGWFTAVAPLTLELAGLEDDPGARLVAVKEARRAMPQRGLGYGLLRYLHGGEASRLLAAAPAAEAAFNFLGSLDAGRAAGGGVVLGSFPAGPGRGPRARRGHLLELNAMVLDGRLELQLGGSAAIHRPETLERLVRSARGELEELIGHCLAPEAGGVTPSDFPEAELSGEELERLLGRIAGGAGAP